VPGVDSGILFTPEQLRTFTVAVFQKVGLNAEDAAVVTDSLIEANLRGVDTHGITRILATYIKRIQKGLMDPKAKPTIVRERAGTALVDANNGIGQVAAKYCMDLAIAKAKQAGVAYVAVTNSNHYGAAAYWTMMALPHDMIGISATNGPASVAPWGGRKPMLSTNPISFALPAGEERPMVLDLATTTVARGRIVLYAKQNRPLEPGWAFDDRGVPTTDAQTALKGLLAPIGGYKGYGLSLVIDLLCGVMTGANYGAHFPGFLAEDFSRPTGVGSIFAAVDVDSFMDLREYKARIDASLREIKTSPLAEGSTRIYIPGEIEAEMTEQRKRDGIPVPEPVVAELEALGQEMGVPFPKGK
jgi:LDH2 family malate/lactate/ureidoglycolate dehydrogenase